MRFVRSAAELIATGQLPVSVVDIEVAITNAIDAMPSPSDVQRVSERLSAGGWPVTGTL